MLALKPSYGHRYQQNAPPTTLTWNTAHPHYDKLFGFLGIMEHWSCPAENRAEKNGWWNKKNPGRSLFLPSGFHYPVRWMPRLKDGWRRLTFEEFCIYYGIIL